MNPNKPTKPIATILKSASSCADIYTSIRNCTSKLCAMSEKSKKIRDAYVLLRNVKTVLLQHGPTSSLMAIVNRNGELSHAIHVDIPKITVENKQRVVRDIVEGIDNASAELMSRLETYSEENLQELNTLADLYGNLAINQKSILCDLRQHISAIDYNEQSLIADTKLCGCSKENFSNRISALRSLQRSLVSPWSDWNKYGLKQALDKFGHTLITDYDESLEPEEQPEEPLEPEITVVPKENTEEGSDTPIPESKIDPSKVTPSVETPVTESMQNLDWSRKTMLDSINSLIAAVDKSKDLSSMRALVSSAVENLHVLSDGSGDPRATEKAILSNRTYFSVCDSVATVYGRELNRLVNDMLGMVVRLHSYLDRKS